VRLGYLLAIFGFCVSGLTQKSAFEDDRGSAIKQSIETPENEHKNLRFNSPHFRGLYIFSKNFEFDFQEYRLLGGDPLANAYDLKDCSDREFHCFSAGSYSLAFPKQCASYALGASFEHNGIKTKIIRHFKRTLEFAIHAPLDEHFDRFILINPDFPYVAYEYGISSSGSGIRKIYSNSGVYEQPYSGLEMKSLELIFSDAKHFQYVPNTRTVDTLGAYVVENIRGVDEFGPCVKSDAS
jgi:hypothetical protein